ncbi:putative quinol monooxygenase [Sphingomonas sp. G-3-2-10]|uniref:putative quinol monooxygenase n=1 Tax=Sphingomonas sp. G-3-2-10 TaxID=2728838 RepID=UPI00146CB999|nr:putative quinol monooxygenase [Sphingomonas sp. G-3-2-10]NML06877.1 antibiotic biosynthesis monooxygenase [Sphingomonas sp. G-3-2-10]
MLVITGTFRVPPANLDAARPVMAAMIAASRAEAGCLHYSYGEDVLEPGLIHVTEHWETAEALAAHGQVDHIRAWRAAWPGLGIGARDLTLFDADEGRGI